MARDYIAIYRRLLEQPGDGLHPINGSASVSYPPS
jgi:hypothetical protein